MRKELTEAITKNNYRLRAKIQAIGVLSEDVSYLLDNAFGNAQSPKTKEQLQKMSKEMKEVAEMTKNHLRALQLMTFKVTTNENENEDGKTE